MPSTNLYWKSHLSHFNRIKFLLSSLVNDIIGWHMIGSCNQNFILTKHRGILYADIVTISSMEVDSFYLCAALLLHTSSIILLCSALEALLSPRLHNCHGPCTLIHLIHWPTLPVRALSSPSIHMSVWMYYNVRYYMVLYCTIWYCAIL